MEQPGNQTVSFFHAVVIFLLPPASRRRVIIFVLGYGIVDPALWLTMCLLALAGVANSNRMLINPVPGIIWCQVLRSGNHFISVKLSGYAKDNQNFVIPKGLKFPANALQLKPAGPAMKV
jgi:hypothetical protein